MPHHLAVGAAELDEDLVDRIEQVGIDEVRVRTPLTCDTRYGLCAKCYGRDLGRGSLVNVCLLYTSDAADDLPCVGLGGRRIIKKKKTNNNVEVRTNS